MRAVIALGGNALLRRTDHPDAGIQQEHVRGAAAAIAPLTVDHQIVVCHGNGPQIGVLAQESEDDPELARPFPLDVLGAQTQGMIGYWLAQELGNAGVEAPVVVVLTRTLVDSSDPAFESPTKFIGRAYSARRARSLRDERGWAVAADGARWRRVVASPEPRAVLEIDTIRRLLDLGAVVVCAGGGGVPVTRDGACLRGVEAVVDKDLTASLVAVEVGADSLVLLTDVPAVARDHGTDRETQVATIDARSPEDLHLAAGSMGPKVLAATRFALATGRVARIGALADADAVLAGNAGTAVVGSVRGRAIEACP